jgi:DNA helicase HerA-like ATPase
VTPELFSLLIYVLAGGFALIGGVLTVRLADQWRRDDERVVVTLRFPRNLTDKQTLSMVRAILGLAPATTGLSGRPSVALDVVGTAAGITHRARLPRESSAYLIAQLRAVVPGLAVDEDESFKPERCIRAMQLRRRLSESDLVVGDMAATARTILAATTGLRRGEVVVWQLVLGGGVGPRPAERSLGERLGFAQAARERRRKDGGATGVAVRIGAVAGTNKRAYELVSRLRRAAASVSAPGARLVPRSLPGWVVAGQLERAATPVTAAAALLTPEETAALWGAPVDTPIVPGLVVGGSPHLPPVLVVPRSGRRLGLATAGGRAVAQPVIGAREHTLIVGPTGSGKSWLSVGMGLGDFGAGRGGVVIDPKGSTARLILERLPEAAIGRTVVLDLTDEEVVVPLPLLAAEAGGIPELAADTLIALLRHRFRDLGPRSSDILASCLYALGRTGQPSIVDLLRLWSDTAYRAGITRLVQDDPVLASFFSWFNGLNPAERHFVLAAPMNKVRPLLARPNVRNVLAAPRATFSMAQALREGLIIIVTVPEGVLGGDATTLIGQVVLARLWAAIQARPGRGFYPVTIDEAPRFLDQPTDLGEVLARSREYGVGMTLIGQSLAQFPQGLREVALNSARTKLAFGTSASDARRLAEEFGPSVEADFFTGLGRFEAIGAVSLGGTVSPPFTFATDALGPAIPGRAATIRRSSRERFGIPRAEIEAAIKEGQRGGSDGPGRVGRRAK